MKLFNQLFINDASLVKKLHIHHNLKKFYAFLNNFYKNNSYEIFFGNLFSPEYISWKNTSKE